MNMTTELIRQAQQGDTHAFAQLYESVYKDLYRFAVYTLHHAQDAEDAVSETVLDAFAQIHTLREAASFKSWIFRILTAKCNRRIRQYINAPAELDESLGEQPDDLCGQTDIQRALASLADEDRLIISMNIFAGYSSQEIGRLLNMNPNTVRSRQSRALKRLESMLA
ncbi:MAG: RNA polymerase sigma factor [Lachnospiraceae bacterium]|nr:RNA polymerase sigma factor [Lachnospiraceae bacterium]